MENLWTALKTFAAIGVMTMIIPLMIAGGSGSWRAGLKAWVAYLKIMGAMVAIFGGFGLVMAIAEHGFGAFFEWLSLLTH